MTDLSTATALVTGAASGIGRLLVLQLLENGARVVAWDIDQPGLQALQTDTKHAASKLHTFRCDLSDGNEIRSVSADVQRTVGHVNLLIHCAGIVSGRLLMELTDEQIERTFAVNTLSLYRVTRAFLPDMLKNNHGHIVTIASAGGIAGTAKLTDYCASKFAAFGFDDALRAELAYLGTDIATTVVCPFYINTGMFDGVKTRFSWLLPILQPEYVVTKIIVGIRRRKARIILPRFVHTTWLVRLLPVRAGDRLMKFLGMTESMENFRGRSGPP